MVRIVDESGNTVVSYVYNAWGKPLSVTPNTAVANAEIVAEMNPLRHRGYYYDTDYAKYYSLPWEYTADVLGNVNRSGYEYSQATQKLWILYLLYSGC